MYENSGKTANSQFELPVCTNFVNVSFSNIFQPRCWGNSKKLNSLTGGYKFSMDVICMKNETKNAKSQFELSGVSKF